MARPDSFVIKDITGWIVTTSPGFLHPYWQRFRASPLWVRLARGFFWSVFGAILSRAVGVISSIIVARVLGITFFGEFTVIQSTVGLFGTFAGLGLGITATKYVAELRDSEPKRCGRVIGLVLMTAVVGGLLAGAALLAFAPWLAAHTLAAPQLAPLLRAGSALVFFSTLQGVYSGALAGFEAFRRVAQVNWIGALVGAPLVVVGSLVAGLEGAVWGSVLQMAVGCAIGQVLVSKESLKAGVRLSFALSWQDGGVLWRFALPAFLSSAIVSPANWIASTLLVNQPQGYEEVALLNAASQWRNLVLFLPLMMITVLTPVFSNLYREGQRVEFRKLLRRNLLINFGVSLAIAVPIALLAPLVLGAYGTGFRKGIPVFTLTVLGATLAAVSNLLSRSMQAIGRAWLDLTFSGLWGLVLVSTCLILVAPYKAMGVAIANTVAAVALAVWQWFLLRGIIARDSVSALGTTAHGSVPSAESL